MTQCRCGHLIIAHHGTEQCLYFGCKCLEYEENRGGLVPVPERYRECCLEYREGYEKGMNEDGAYNPVSKKRLKARRAWEAGRQAGRKKRHANQR